MAQTDEGGPGGVPPAPVFALSASPEPSRGSVESLVESPGESLVESPGESPGESKSEHGVPLGLPLMPGALQRGRGTALMLGGAVALLVGLLPVIKQRLDPFSDPLQAAPAKILGALAFLIAGLTLSAAAFVTGRETEVTARRLRWLVRTGGALVLGLALATWGLGPATGVLPLGFLLVGGTLLLLDRTSLRRPHPAEWLALSAGWIGALALTGSMLSIAPQDPLLQSLLLPPPAAVALVVLSVGLLCVRAERGLAALAASATSGGTMMRRLVPLMLTVPPLGIWLLVELAPRIGLFDPKLGAALGAMLGGAVVAVSTSKLAARLADHDTELQAHQFRLRRALEDLALALRDRDRVQQDLARSNRDLDEFAYAASHDLRAPLRGISNLAHWVEEDLGTELPANTRKQLDLLRGRVNRMESLIDGILKYSRAGRVLEPQVEVAVEALLRESIELSSPPPGARIDIGPGMPQLTTERAQLQQVFLNLISNALKHTRRGDPHVRITVEDQGDMLRFTIADNGPGIPLQYQERIWGMFQTLESRDQVEGTGIGLATVKKLVERRGGQVGVESAEGQGARFFFLWPRHHVA